MVEKSCISKIVKVSNHVSYFGLLFVNTLSISGLYPVINSFLFVKIYSII